MTIIMTKTPMIVMTDVRACVMPILQGRRNEVDVIDDAREDVTLRMRIVVGQRDAVKLLLGLLAQRIDDVLRHARHHERLQIRKYLIANVQDDKDEQDLPKQIEVHARTRLAIGNRDTGPEYLRRGQTQLGAVRICRRPWR